jgi:hypothetical protein
MPFYSQPQNDVLMIGCIPINEGYICNEYLQWYDVGMNFGRW